MKDATPLAQSKKNLGQCLRKSALVLGSRVSSCVSKKSEGDKRQSRPSIRLIDANGADLTPLPLLTEDRRNKEEKDISTEFSQTSVQSGSSLHITNPFAFTRSFVSGSSPTGDSNSEVSDENVDRFRGYAEVKTLAQPQREVLSEADLNKLVDVKIAETDTFWIFDRAPTVTSQDADDAQQQTKRTAAYKALLASRAGNDRYMERGMNTSNNPVIPKSVQTMRIITHERAAMATVWDMADTFKEEISELSDNKVAEPTSPTEPGKHGKIRSTYQTDGLAGGTADQTNRTVLQDFAVTADPIIGATDSAGLGNSTTPKDTMVSNSESDLFGFRYSAVTQTSFYPKAMDILKLPRLVEDIDRMERALNVNTYYDKLLQYEALHLRTIMTPLTLDRSDTDPSSTGPKVPGMRTPSLDDNSAGQQTGAKHSNAGGTASGHSMGSTSQTGIPLHGKGVDVDSPVAATNPDTSLLWRYQCSLTKGRNVTDMAWNKENPNILAVGYGKFEFENQKKGLVCCWSLKFIEYPERFYETPSAVTAVGWSKIHSNLLAVGMFSGVIYVFDVRKNDPTPVIDTTHAAGRHLGAVRKVQWVVRQSGRAENLSEVLVSVSTDGRVTEWSVRKGFDSTGDCDYHTDLMVLKRSYVSAPGTVNKPKRSESLISRTAFGSCMAFNKRDPSIYVVGTEDGPIHKCSCSYNEQYLETFLGHTAPVYQIEWSPFVPDVFLSCSADWTIKLWHLDHTSALISIQTHISMVSSISWSPFHSLIFASANESALEIWNLDSSTIEPYVVETVSSDSNMTSVLFSECSDSVLVGDNQGTVHVYGLQDFPETPTNTLSQAAALAEILQTCIKEQS
ncbi:WD repeat-containing protein 78 [Clonorchis sinensis]|uniref:Dynein axonemal intermediate chain 4 n=2 Tax=Clonorchis sinensis TaxID=79923 RepID=H2KQB6_CLOSI|nr:WD repeat-containing protein 78 [Clonorchis sinensis]GAA33263.2 WD repeat-containing protein 78 [Clonorchis sinensis]